MAISAAHEAVGIFRAMSNDFEARLADALRKLAVCTAIGDPRRGVNHAQESVAIYRRLANDRSGTGQQGLARALNTLSNSLAGQGDLARSLAAVVEAVQMQATLADGGLPADEIFYATCLDNLSRRLADAGEIEDATDRVNLAIEIRRRGGRRRELAQSLTTLSRLMCAQNRIEDAFHAADEAVTICRAEAKRSDFHYFNVTAATDNYANLRAMMQHHEVDAGASGRPLVVELFGDLTAGSDWGAILPTGPDSEGLDQS